MQNITNPKRWRFWLTSLMMLLFAWNLSAQVTVEIGTGTLTMGHPYYSLYEDSRTQMIFTAAEITAGGGAAGQITSLAFNVQAFNAYTLSGMNVDMQHTTATTLSAFTSTGWSNCFSGTYSVPANGWQTITFTTPFTWDGTSNLLVNICYDNAGWSGNSYVYGTAAAGMTWHMHTDGAAGCSLTPGTTQANRPNVRLTIVTGPPPPPPSVTVQVGTGTTGGSYPYYTLWMDSRTQMLYPASEIFAAGGVPGEILSVGFNVTTANAQVMNGFNIDMQNYSGATVPAFVSTGWTNVFTGTYFVPGTGIQTIPLQNTFIWDGVSNLLVSVCFNNSTYAGNSTVLGTILPGLVAHGHSDLPAGDGCVDITAVGASYTTRANIILDIVPSAILPTGTVQGFVTNGFGVPVANATVAADGINGSFVTTSGPNGAYIIEDISIGTYTMAAVKDGYNMVTVEGVVIMPTTTTYQNFELPRPSMAVTPNPYNVTVNPNEMLEGAFNIANNGDGTLEWTAEIVYPDDAGSIAPGIDPTIPVRDFTNATQVESFGAEATVGAGNGQALNSRTTMLCPAGSLFSNAPVGSDNGYTAAGAYTCYQQFSGVTGSFNTLTFWAIFTSAPPATMDFQIEICGPGASQPGAVVSSLTATLTPANTGTPVIGYDTYMFTAQLPATTLPAGWIGIHCNTAAPTFYWLNSYTGTGAGVQLNAGSYVPLTEYLAMCLTGGGSGGMGDGWLTLGSYEGTVHPYGNYSNPAFFNASGAEAGQVYTAEVIFTSEPNVGTVTVPVTMVIAGPALEMPEDLTAVLSNPVTGQVNLAWNFNPTDAFLNFAIRRNGVVVGYTATNNYVDMLPAFGIYDYTVQAVYDEGMSSPAGPVQVEWANPTALITPLYIYDEVWVNNQVVETVTISNTGLGTLAFTFPEWVEDDGNRAPLAYCAASGGCDEYIGTFIFGDQINNSSGCTNYGDYTAISADVEMGETYAVTIQNPSPWASDIAAVYVDWNQNESFTDAGETYVLTQGGGGATFTGNILVPEDAVDGTTRMRVRLQFGGTLSSCGTTSYGEVEDYSLNVAKAGFITSVVPAEGFVQPGQSRTVAITWDATGWDPGASYLQDLVVNTNDLAHPSVTIVNEMYVFTPAQFAGIVTNGDTGEPLNGVMVTANPTGTGASFTAMTNEEGEYNVYVNPGSYTVTFDKSGFQSYTEPAITATQGVVTTLNAQLFEAAYPPSFVYAEVNETDTQVVVTWGDGSGPYEILYDDGSAENYAAWALPGNLNAVKFTPAEYPAVVIGGKVYVGDGSFPNNNTGFIGTTFGMLVLDNDGANGLPGTVLDSISVTVNNYGWVTFTGFDVEIADGDFYLAMMQSGISPNVAPIGIDEDIPTLYRSYSRNVVGGGNWGLSPFQDMMIRAIVYGSPAATDAITAAASTVQLVPQKQRALISQSAPLATSGVEGAATYRVALDIEDGSRAVASYRVVRYSDFDPNNSPATGTVTPLTNSVAGNTYTDPSSAWVPLPAGWYAYGVAANYPNGDVSDFTVSNIVGHKILAQVTVNVSLTTGGSPEGAVVTLTGQVYPYEVYTATVPADGQIVFPAVWYGPYVVEAMKVGFDDYVINVNITGNRTINIILLEKKYKPRNLYVDPLTLVATWDEPLALAVAEDFEGVFPPAGWQAITQNTTGWFGSSSGGSTNFAIPSHSKYAVVNDDIDNGNGCCDYLITPEMDWTNLTSYRLNFASFYNGTYAQSAYIEISTDAGATWTVVNTLQAAPSGWVDVEVDLTQYSGANGLSSVWLAFHADDNGEWSSGWAVDDVQIASGGVPFDGYGVFLDGTLVDNTPEETYTYRDLNYGQEYLAGVAALFSSGYSELDTYLFRSQYLYPPDSLQGMSPTGTDYAHLWWMPPSSPTGLGDNTENLPVIIAQPAADIALDNDPNHTFPQRSIPLSSSRVVLFDNGPLVNSPGTGSGGADESILQGGLGMTTYGAGFQQTAGNSVADDFEVTAPWTIQNFEFFGYQTGSTTTSTFTGAYCRVWDGDPTAGGAIIWGDLTTNRMISTEWANIYRNNNGPGGSTDRPVMRIVAETPGLALTPGTYWVEWCTAGSGSSGPWVPAVTIQGQTTTGNAKQNVAGAWADLIDVGPQGMPFIINGAGGGAVGIPTNLLGYNLYRNDAVAAYIESPTTEYFDMNLDPGTYLYDVTAVYDLTPYGYPGQTAESMKEGTVEIDIIYGYTLPFMEDWNTGLFSTNQWTAQGANWRIAGQAGNPAPAAEFYYSPAQTDYALSLTSSWINGRVDDNNLIDGDIWLDFDLKIQDLNQTGDETLQVEIFNGSAWSTVATYTAEGNVNWDMKHINITSQAKNKVFRVRFNAKGVNSLDIYNWMIDNIHIYRQCAPATELTATEESSPGHLSVILNWTAPSGGTGPGISAWLAWDSGENGDAIGLQGGGTFSIAARFTPTQLTQYAGTSLTKMRFFPYAPGGTIVLKVWTGANASQLVLTQPVASYTAGQWNEVTLSTAVPVTGATELWFGYTVTHGADYVAGCDNGPAVAGFGDMISTDGSTWESMSTAYGLDYNWNLQGFVETIDGVSAPLQSISDNTVYGPVSKLTAGNYPALPGAALPTEVSGSRAFVGYNVYRDGIMIATTEETTYTDADQAILAIGSTFCYTVGAVYEDCEAMTEEVCILLVDVPTIGINELSIYPNPSSSVVNIKLSNDIRQMVVYNYLGQVVTEMVITKDKEISLDVTKYEAGAYLLKFTTTNGENITRKVVVTH